MTTGLAEARFRLEKHKNVIGMLGFVLGMMRCRKRLCAKTVSENLPGTKSKRGSIIKGRRQEFTVPCDARLIEVYHN